MNTGNFESKRLSRFVVFALFQFSIAFLLSFVVISPRVRPAFWVSQVIAAPLVAAIIVNSYKRESTMLTFRDEGQMLMALKVTIGGIRSCSLAYEDGSTMVYNIKPPLGTMVEIFNDLVTIKITKNQALVDGPSGTIKVLRKKLEAAGFIYRA